MKMVKRKFSGKEDNPKKSKTSVNEIPETLEAECGANDDVSSSKESKNNGFDIKHFRKELAAKQGQTVALTQFLAACQQPEGPDVLLQYLQAGGSAHELLRQAAPDPRSLPLATPAFHLFHLIILKVQATAPHLLSITEEAARYFLNQFASTADIMVSESSGPRHRKVILKLLTSMVTLNPELGVEVLSLAALTPKNLHHVLEKPNYKEHDNVRTTFVHFMTSFLVEGHLPLVKALLEKQGLLPLVLPGLVQDEAEAVLMFLNILKKNVVDNALISKSLKMKTFSQNVLHQLFKIYFWKGPPGTSHEVVNESRPDITKLLDEIILTLFTSHKLGIYFVDSSLGTSDANKNQNLYKALLSLKRPWEHKAQCAVVLEITQRCPDLHRAVIHLVEQNFEPQHSPIWERTVDFVIKLLTSMKTEDMVPRFANLNPGQVTNFVRFTALPVPLLKVIQTSLGKAERTVSLYCVKVLVKMLSSLKRYLQILDDINVVDLKNKLEYFLPKHLPAPAVLVSLINQIINKESTNDVPSEDYSLPNITDADSLILLIDLLLLYSDVHPAHFESLEGSLNMKQILDFSSTLPEGHISILQFKIVSLWLTLDHSAVSVSNPLFKELFQIMLQVYTSDDTETWTEAKETIFKFFKTTAIFETDEEEIHIMLYTLRHTKMNTAYLVDIVQYILENQIELTEYVRTQMVQFEVTAEDNEANLEKLLNDLMKGGGAENTCFLESKVPSPFIVGCLRYCQRHKNVNKDLKSFLSLYIANLLHSNCSPELTQLLASHCAPDTRQYIAGWQSQPGAIPDETVARDATLGGISQAIIQGKDLVIQDIFPFIQESPEEDNALVASNTSYKVNRDIDSSDLLIWAKYIIFCTVRLANMGLLQETQQAKIILLFDFVISLAKYQHKQDICRTIMLGLLKRPHVLKLYSPIDLNKDESRILTTNFLLHIINGDKETIDYLNKRRDVLKSYQQKNYHEVVKTVAKIKKRKTINTAHTVKILEIVGMSSDDDVRILNQIMELDAAVCVREDKEPSVVLEIVRVLVAKYWRSIKSDLPQDVLQKILNLYTKLLCDKSVTPNLTNLETALVDYFENKPQHVKLVSAESFKQFFYANAMRKSTSQLAATLLRFDVQFCNIFKEQVERKEILSQRELTLPLGCALLHHSQFLAGNKPFLDVIFNEYKSNILKVLEKPHKAGQVYTTCWQFIRKLLLECINVQDCQKFFNKSHKFEVVELSHVHLMQAVYLRLHLQGLNTEYLSNYFLSMLNITTMALKESKDGNVINEIAMSVEKIVEITATSPDYEVESFGKLTESSVWQNFFKAALKDSLRVKGENEAVVGGPRLLRLLGGLVRLLYPVDHGDIVSLFDMVTSHSEFLKIMLSHGNQKLKTVLVEFLYVLISKNKSVMKTPQIPVYLSAYHATTSQCDRVLLKILHFYETNDQPVHEYKPYLWGESAANHYAVRKKKAASLWAHPTPNQVLNLFDRDLLERTVRNFPVFQRLDYDYELPADLEDPLDSSAKSLLRHLGRDGVLEASPDTDNEAAVKRLCLISKYAKCGVIAEDLTATGAGACRVIYDPCFFLPLLSHVLAPGSAAACGKLLRHGVLALPIAALAAACPAARAAAAHVLHRFCLLLQTETRQRSDKLLLTEFIALLQRSMPVAGAGMPPDGTGVPAAAVPRLPAVSALYLSRALGAAAAPASALYKPVNNFLIAKQRLDLTVLPDFLSLFHDSDVETADRKNWLLETIRDGTRTMADVNVIFKTMCLKMIMDYYSSVLSDRRCKERVLGVVAAVAGVPRACEILLQGYGLLSWLQGVARRLTADDRILFKAILHLVQNVLRSVSTNALANSLSLMQRHDKCIVDLPELKLNKDLEHDVVIILSDMISFVEHSEGEDTILFVKTFNLLSKRTVKLLSKKQMLCLITECKVLGKESDRSLLLTKAVTSNNADILKCKSLSTSECSNLIQELKCLVTSYML